MTRGWSLPGDLAPDVERHLDQIVDPCSTASVLSMSILAMGLIRDVTFSDDGVLTVHLRLTSPSCMMVGYIAREATARLRTLPGVTEVLVGPDEGLDWDPSMMDAAVAQERNKRLRLLDLSNVIA
ncbi:iron-sulfur cluster assembly protein [Dactylosporangium sp. AC04546]|uniref:metal-sulfur cluster assembly factor n=1 Tax=Dactylosporangium sp. AC04546 TaxID=2862460 RepID=UPI001EDDFD6C|nr:iron-sulfur cluster assembly protein [Dactylosporangium sp. AC04546]WVK80913.1 iron-sulfur cluster assembly protein [Dactylosporangium sp. AC04546]